MSVLNLYRELLEIMPAQALQVGVVQSIADGTATVELAGGGIVRARGNATVDQTVYVRDGVIEGTAPTLTVVSIDI